MSRAPARRLHWLRVLTGVVLALALALPAAAYTIYFKDGSKLIAREKYRIEGTTAHIFLQNGTRAIYEASQIDVERTEKANQSEYGTAFVLEGGAVKEVAVEDIPRRDQPTLRDLIRSGAAGPATAPDRAAADLPAPSVEPEPVGPPVTAAGFVDLGGVERQRFPDADVAGELEQVFVSREVPDVNIYQGTNPRRPFVEVVAGSEASVFRAIRVAAVGLLALDRRHPGRVEAIELLLTTPKGARAGQFLITPEVVDELKTVDTATFFLRHVEF